jgi:asparagine synthase (glutamine-hydrolysing)
VPFGTFLSGGIDSSLVTAIAQHLSDKPVKTFSIGFKEGKFNEAHHARAVAKHLNTEHNEKILSYNDALDLLETVFETYDEPFADSSAFPTLLVSKFAREHVTVILSGDGGDETYLGYGFYEWGKRLNNPFVKTFRKPIASALSLGNSRYKRAAQLFQNENEDRLKSHIFSQEQYLFSATEVNVLLTDDYKESILFNEKIITPNRQLSFTEQQALFDMKYYLQDDLLVKVDRASMQHSLEVRVPLIDYRLIHFALNLSEDLRKQNGITKYLLKEVLYDFVPKHFFDRPKWGFGIPLGEWLQKDWKFLIDDYLNKEAIENAGIFNYQVVNQLVQRFFKGETYLYNRIWLVIIVQKLFCKLS